MTIVMGGAQQGYPHTSSRFVNDPLSISVLPFHDVAGPEGDTCEQYDRIFMCATLDETGGFYASVKHLKGNREGERLL